MDVDDAAARSGARPLDSARAASNPGGERGPGCSRERAMHDRRSNADWLKDLREEGGAQAEALEDLRRYLLRVLPTSLRRHGAVRDDLLDDVVQDAIIRALDRLDDFEGRSRFTTWVVTIAVRIAMTELRRRRWKDVSLDALTLDGTFTPDECVDRLVGPETRTAQLAILRAMQEIFDTELSPRQRTAIVAELRGMPQEEIGRHLGINRNAVYKLGYDARKKLKRGLEASGFDVDEIRACFA